MANYFNTQKSYRDGNMKGNRSIKKMEREEESMTKNREYGINGAMIISVDHGYGNIKTVHRVFPANATKSDKAPIFSRDYLEYNGMFYIIGEGHKPFVADKITDNDYYILTLAALAMELKERGLNSGRVHLAAGLPLKWVKEQREQFKDYLLQNGHVEFQFRGELFVIDFTGCTIMPQCYSAVAENLKDYKGLNMLVDIGNGTMNIMYLNNGRAMENKSWTEKFGVHQCSIKIRNAVMDTTGEAIDSLIIDNFLRYGETDVAEPYASIIRKTAEEYVANIFAKLREYDFNDKLMKLHFIGGGSRIVQAVGEYDKERTFFNCDIRATAKGYEYYCYMILMKQKQVR